MDPESTFTAIAGQRDDSFNNDANDPEIQQDLLTFENDTFVTELIQKSSANVCCKRDKCNRKLSSAAIERQTKLLGELHSIRTPTDHRREIHLRRSTVLHSNSNTYFRLGCVHFARLDGCGYTISILELFNSGALAHSVMILNVMIKSL